MKPQEPWNSKAIEAIFDGILIEEHGHLRFYYVLKNRTNKDYRLANGSHVDVMMKVRRGQKSLLVASDRTLKMDYPIFVPAGHQRILMMTDMTRTYDFKQRLPINPSLEEHKEYENKLEALVRSERPDLQAFVVFDRAARYQINLPRAW